MQIQPRLNALTTIDNGATFSELHFARTAAHSLPTMASIRVKYTCLPSNLDAELAKSKVSRQYPQ
jgi:hypothetical protein